VQNDFLSVWVNYEVQRMSLDFDLGSMQLDDCGLWIDPGAITAENLGLGDPSDSLETIFPEPIFPAPIVPAPTFPEPSPPPFDEPELLPPPM
jgi:hypothetical protein